jgi:hypothetical protein
MPKAGNPEMKESKNIFQMYVENKCKVGFYVTRDSWMNGKYARVAAIDGVKNGEMIDGEPPYFTRKYPPKHPKEGKIWPRTVTLKADWLDDGEYIIDTAGTYSWTRVYPKM